MLSGIDSKVSPLHFLGSNHSKMSALSYSIVTTFFKNSVIDNISIVDALKARHHSRKGTYLSYRGF